ncbi:hypothetical protein ACFXKS_34915 [Streptomyces scopuliridis]|uniref:hypothetical protein n=1 Tax=Streptomyces scopuliridis TaxID=452529 RepID=UPI003698B79A
MDLNSWYPAMQCPRTVVPNRSPKNLPAADRERESEEAIHQGAIMNSAESIPSRSTTGPQA